MKTKRRSALQPAMTYDEMHARHVENMRLGKPVFYGFSESEMARAQILLRDSIARDKVERERAEAQRIREAEPDVFVESKSSSVTVGRYGHKGGFRFTLRPHSDIHESLSVYLVSFDLPGFRTTAIRCLQKRGPMMGTAQLRLIA